MAAINDASKYLADNDAFKKTCFLFYPCKISDRKTPVFSDVKSWDHWFCEAKCVGKRHLWFEFARLRDCTRSMWVTDAVLGSPFRDV